MNKKKKRKRQKDRQESPLYIPEPIHIMALKKKEPDVNYQAINEFHKLVSIKDKFPSKYL